MQRKKPEVVKEEIRTKVKEIEKDFWPKN